MNDILLNASIAFGMLSVLIVPLYIASRSSQKNKARELKHSCESLADRENLNIDRLEFAGNKAFAFTGTGQVLILLKHSAGEEYCILNRALIESFLIVEHSEGGRLSELKFIYQESGRKRELSVYKEYRDKPEYVDELRKISNGIKQFLSR